MLKNFVTEVQNVTSNKLILCFIYAMYLMVPTEARFNNI